MTSTHYVLVTSLKKVTPRKSLRSHVSPPPAKESLVMVMSSHHYNHTYARRYVLVIPSHGCVPHILLWWGDIPPTYHSSMNSLGCMSNDMDLMRCLCLHVVPGVTDGGCTQPKVAVCKCASIHAYTYIH